MTHKPTEAVSDLIHRAEYMVGNPSAWDSYDERASEIIRALIRTLRSASGVSAGTVKALEWIGDEADTPIGKYRLYRTDDGYGLSFNHEELVHVGFDSVGGFESPYTKAASYADPHYRHTILSCLTPSPAREITPDEMQLLRRLLANQQTNIHDVVEGDQHLWTMGKALSDCGLIAIVSHPRGGIFYITRLGVQALTAAMEAGKP